MGGPYRDHVRMRRFSFYHRATGVFAELVYSAHEPELALNTPPDHVAIEGVFHPLSHRFDLATGGVVRANAPTADHAWNAATGRWEISPEVAAAREKRKAILAEIARLEGQQGRALREAILGGGNDRLTELDARIAELRKGL